MKTFFLIAFYLTLAFILICGLTAKADEPLLSFYQASSDKDKTVIECHFTDGRRDQRLVVKNDELDGKAVEEWVSKRCTIK